MAVIRFDFDGEKYKKASRHQKSWGNRLISELSLSGAETILDLGCGDGVLTARLASLVPDGRVLGIDASEGMIAAAKQLEGDNLSFHVMDIDEIDFDADFDVVFSNAALHWVKDHDKLLRNAHQALRPGGIIRFNFAAENNCENFEAIAHEMISVQRFAWRFKDFEWPWYTPSLSEYEALLGQFDFAEVRVWGAAEDTYFANEDELVRWVEQPGIVPFLQHLNGRDTEVFRDWFVQKMIRRTKLPDGRHLEKFKRINLYARK